MAEPNKMLEETANYLLNHCFVLGGVEDQRAKYLYVQDHLPEVRAVFAPLGYAVTLYPAPLQAAALVNEHEGSQARLLKYESILLLVLRLLYLQKRESLAASADQVLVTVEEVQTELQKMNLPRRLDQRTLEELMRTLRRYNLARPVGRLTGLDSRIILNRMSLLKERLAEIDKQKMTQRKNRGRMIRVALVGYTNVGKSTLMNLLSKSEVFAENKLFATLDTTVRKVIIDNLPFLLTDTVGFIRKLPTDLVDSFKSTLDEVREADLLIHVVDISHPDFEEQIAVVDKTIADLGAGGKPTMIVFNKIDAYTYIEKPEDDLTPKTKENITLDELMNTWMAKLNDNCIFISAKEKTNLEELKEVIYNKVRELHVQKYPYNDFLYQTYDETDVSL